MWKKNKQVLTPADMIGRLKRPMLTRKHWLRITSALLFIIISVNSYFLFKPDSIIERTYYVNEYGWQMKKNYKQFLTKQSVVSSKEVITITADATELDQIHVKKGQMIYTDDPLAIYNEASRQQSIREKEVELNAYNLELVDLKDALEEVERQAANQPSNSYINTDQIAGNISVEIEMEIVQNNMSSEASAILLQHIAELERNITITRASLDDLKEEKAIKSPIDGSIGDIIYTNGSVTFEIHSTEKNIIAYLTEPEWREVKLDQSVIVKVQGYDKPMEGVVVAMQEFPAQQSVWLQRLSEVGAIKQDEPVYEIRVDVNDVLLLTPFNSLAEAEITIQEVNDSYIVPSHWIVQKEIENVSSQHINTIDYAGKIRLEPITVLHETSVDAWNTNEVNKESGKKDSVAERQLNAIKRSLKKSGEQPQNITAFTMNTNDPITLLNGGGKRNYAASFLPLPIQMLSFGKVGEFTWKDVLYYLLY